MPAYKSVARQGTVSSVEDSFNTLEELGNECREIVDNASEGLQQTQRIQTFEETASTLEGLSCPDVPTCIADLAIEYTESVPTRKRQSPSRYTRCQNEVAVLTAAKDAAETWLEEHPEIDEDEAEEHDAKVHEGSVEDGYTNDDRSEVEQFISELDDAISNAEGCEFPGMYG